MSEAVAYLIGHNRTLTVHNLYLEMSGANELEEVNLKDLLKDPEALLEVRVV